MNVNFVVSDSVEKNISGNFLTARIIKNLCSLFLAGMALVAAKESAAYSLLYSNLSNGYSNCSYKDNGNGTSNIKVSISYKPAAGHTGGAPFTSRGIILNSYNAQGGPNMSSSVAAKVYVGGVANNLYYKGDNYYLYYNDASTAWSNSSAFIASIEMNIDNSVIKDWPAIGVRAANTTNNAADVAESLGVAYIGKSTKNGICQLLTNPEQPPPPMDVILNMTAPDWNLGELARAEETTKTLSAVSDQLCFSYEGAQFVTFQKYIINATSINGLSANGRYLLKSLEDSSQTIPYNLTLKSTTDSIVLPNTTNTVLSLSGTGRTCFTPTFKTSAPKWVKGGAFSDVLTFTVVAKP